MLESKTNFDTLQYENSRAYQTSPLHILYLVLFILVDEGMIGFKGRLSFRQYMPPKMRKYGIKVWMAADASKRFVIDHQVYLGKQTSCVLANGLGYSMVNELISPFLNLNHHVHFDNLFLFPKIITRSSE